jgi:hypothetical protein
MTGGPDARVRLPAPAAGARPRAPRPCPADSARLIRLLRAQLRAAASGSWGELGALSASLRAELELGPGPGASPVHLAEIAHLQLRLQRTIESQAQRAATRLRLLQAQHLYRRFDGSRRPGEG